MATSALVKNSDKLSEAIANARSGDLSKEVSVNLNSIGLLTPDTFRSILSGGESKGMNEKKMLEDQLKAWEQLSSEPQPKVLTVKDENGEDVQVRVRIKVNAFNFGVNGGAFHSTGLDVVSGWQTSDAQNAKAMAAMIGTPEEREGGGFGGEVGEWLRNAPRNTPEERQAVANVEALARQIAEMWDSRSHRQMGAEPYKMVSRLAVLSSMIGNDVCWNCKSGKDRTGECDVESKYLAMQIWLTGQVPEPLQPRTREEKRNFFPNGRGQR